MPQTTHWTPSAGVRLGDRYTVERELGTGGIARVWLAQDHPHDRRVALKHPKFTGELYRSNPDLAEKLFTRELKTLQQVAAAGGHPNIVTLYDTLTVRGTPLAVLEVVDGPELSEAPALSEANARIVTMQLADAMAFLHRHEIIYRDLKPDNAMLRRDGAPVLIDFNTAKGFDTAISAEPTCPACDATVGPTDRVCPACSELFDGSDQTAIGRPNEVWRAPELVEDRAHLRQGPWTDVYSLGKILFALLAGPTRRIPANPGARPDDLRTDPIECQPYLAAIIERATRTDPSERYANAEVLATVLDAKDVEPPIVAELVHLASGQRTEVYPGDTVGRHAAAGPSPTYTVEEYGSKHVSAVHFQFAVDSDGAWYLRDPRSLNGTYVRQNDTWQWVLSERGREARYEAGRDPRDAADQVPPEQLRLHDGAVIAPADKGAAIRFEFRTVTTQ